VANKSYTNNVITKNLVKCAFTKLATVQREANLIFEQCNLIK
jgi:hypothetical protein